MLFVGTKKQASDAVKEAATNAGMPYVNQRWLGGLLTNFQTLNEAHQAPAPAHRVDRGRHARAAAHA